MTGFYLRLDEENKSDAQIQQRDRTYEAAKLLRRNGFECEVRELFTGKDTQRSTACIHLKLEGEA